MGENLFDLTGRVAIITGGAGLLGQEHAKAIAEAGGIPVIWDIAEPNPPHSYFVDITNYRMVKVGLDLVWGQYGHVDILINNAAINSQVGESTAFGNTLVRDIEVGLLGAINCCEIVGGWMAREGGGVIINIGSDFSHIAPDPKDYAPNVKPVSYSVVKAGIHGLTRYLAAYWAGKGVRVNTLSPGGVLNGQPAGLVERISAKIPLGRMANPNEYRGAIQFLASDASAYMTGQELIVDGGRSIL